MFSAPSLLHALPPQPLHVAAQPSASLGPDANVLARARNVYLHARLRLETYKSNVRVRTMRRDPRLAQQRLLTHILTTNSRTTFGVQHGFATIRDYTSFARQVPVMDQAHLQDWLRYHHERDGHALYRGDASAMLLDPSGSMVAVRAEIARQHAFAPGAFDGDLLMLSARRAHRYVAACSTLGGKQVLPPGLAEFPRDDHRDLMALRLALEAPDVTYVQATDAAELLRWTGLLERRHRYLFKAMRRGEWLPDGDLPPALQSANRLPLRPSPERAQALASQRSRSGSLSLADLWPQVKLIALTQRSALDEIICAQWPAAHLLILGSENDYFSHLLTLAHDGNTCLPAADRYFFEFAACNAKSGSLSPPCTLNDVQTGMTYALIISHAGGLYRYLTGDRVLVTGKVDGLPVMRRLEPNGLAADLPSAELRIAA